MIGAGSTKPSKAVMIAIAAAAKEYAKDREHDVATLGEILAGLGRYSATLIATMTMLAAADHEELRSTLQWFHDGVEDDAVRVFNDLRTEGEAK